MEYGNKTEGVYEPAVEVRYSGSSEKSEEPKQEDVHFWRPPCSCGVSLDDVVDKK